MAKYSIITTDVTDVISSLFQKKLEWKEILYKVLIYKNLKKIHLE
jgi:hypothetical protein